MMHRVFGIFGPSHVGKSTFVQHLLQSGRFRAAPIWTTRPRRKGENDPIVHFTTREELAAMTAEGEWVQLETGGNAYAVSVDASRRLSAETPLIVGLTPRTTQLFRSALPDMLTVLMVPEDEALLERNLLADDTRPLPEREDRARRNREDREAGLTADIVLTVRFLPNAEARRAQLETFADRLLRAV